MARVTSFMSVGMLFLSPSLSMACGTSSDPVAVVQAQLDAFNAHDVEAFAACYADNVTTVELGGKHTVTKGIPALKTAYAFLTKMPKEFHVEIVQRTASGPTVVDLERAVGLPGRKDQPEAVAVYEVREGKILNVWFPPKS